MVIKLSQLGIRSASPKYENCYDPEPWTTSDDGFNLDDITNMYLPPAETKPPVDTLAPSDDSGLHLKRFSSISKMINIDYNKT